MRSDRTPRPDWSLIARHALAATARRPTRSALVAVGVALGTAIVVVIVGWTQTVGSEINATFDRHAATELRVRDTAADTATDAAMPVDFEERVSAIAHVVAGGRAWGAGAHDVSLTEHHESISVPVLVADPGFLAAASVDVRSGRLFDAAVVALGQPVAVLGSGVAERLGVGSVEPGMALTVGRTRVMVIGVLAGPSRAPELDGAIVVPPTAPVGPGDGPPIPTQQGALVRVELGAAASVATALPLALRPHDPQRLGVTVPPEPSSLRGQVEESLEVLAYGAAALSLLVGGVSIMNAMAVAVTERSGEIGLRRALGGSSWHVAVQFLGEGAILGLGGSVAGAVAGEVGLVALAWVNGWTPVLDGWVLAAAPAAGLVVGIVGSLQPALRAAQVRPAASLRG